MKLQAEHWAFIAVVAVVTLLIAALVGIPAYLEKRERDQQYQETFEQAYCFMTRGDVPECYEK